MPGERSGRRILAERGPLPTTGACGWWIRAPVMQWSTLQGVRATHDPQNGRC